MNRIVVPFLRSVHFHSPSWMTTAPISKSSDQIAKELSKEEYYHGLLPREDMITLLRRNGEFLIRFSETKKGEKSFIMSTMANHEIGKDGLKHFVITKTTAGKFVIEKFGFTTIPEMIAFHIKGDPITKDGKVIITTPIRRQTWEHNHEDVTIGKKLGEGAFGEVSLGTLKIRHKLDGGSKPPSVFHHQPVEEIPVAIKLAKLESLTKEQIKEIMSEARLMRRFDHPNVVKFYGVATLQEPLMVLMELCSNGALDSYLQKNPNQPIDKLNEMAMQAAWGLEFIHRNNVIHRDIAARNCLYGGGNVKIADFGLSREGNHFQMDPHSRVPIRWLAPEVITTAMFTHKTDVWAFGIMCWEIYHDGKEPYPDMSVAQVATAVRQDDYRMTFRPTVRPDVSEYIVQKVWDKNPDTRPYMIGVVQEFGRLFNMANRAPK